jgi:hypothetical protein
MSCIPLVGLSNVKKQSASVDEGLRGPGADLRCCSQRSNGAGCRGRQPCGVPRAVAAKKVGDIRKASTDEHAGGDLGAIPAGAVEDHWAVGIEAVK